MMFTKPLAAKIIQGKKTATRRVMSTKLRSPWFEGGCTYDVGQIFTVNPGRGVPRVAECEVTRVYSQPPEELRAKDAKAEGFESKAAFLDAFLSINGPVGLGDPVWVVEFKLHGPDCRYCDGCGWCEGSPAWTCTHCFGTGWEPSARGKALVAEVAA